MRKLIRVAMILFGVGVLIYCLRVTGVPGDPLQSPLTDGHWLGTDRLGRDIVCRSVRAISYTLLYSLAIMTASSVIGIPLAALSAITYDRGLDRTIVRFAEALRAFPVIILALLFVALGGSGVIVLVMYFWVPVWRVLRTTFVAQNRVPYALSAQLVGMSKLEVLLREILPVVLGPVSPYLAALFAEVVSAQCALEFLGFGPAIEQPSLGGMLLESIQLGFSAPWVWLPSLFATCFIIWSISFIAGRSVRSARWVGLE